jgi:hypothetical protein
VEKLCTGLLACVSIEVLFLEFALTWRGRLSFVVVASFFQVGFYIKVLSKSLKMME